MKAMVQLIFMGLLMVSFASSAQEYKNYDVEKLLRSAEEPAGVVFEIVSFDKAAWDWASPMLNQFRSQLLNKYPNLDVAVVTHGGEQFELTKDKAEKNKDLFSSLQSLTDQGVDLHVCGTHSSWRNVDESEYIDIVDVSPSGPAQINDYIKLGFTHVLLQAP